MTCKLQGLYFSTNVLHLEHWFLFFVWNVCWIFINFQSSKCCEFECGIYTLHVTYCYMFKRKGKHWWVAKHTKLWSAHLKIINNHGNWSLYQNPQASPWHVGHYIKLQLFLFVIKKRFWYPMKGLCINLVKDHDYPPNYGIIFYKKKSYLKKTHIH